MEIRSVKIIYDDDTEQEIYTYRSDYPSEALLTVLQAENKELREKIAVLEAIKLSID